MEAPLLVAWLDLGTDHGLEFSTALRCWAQLDGYWREGRRHLFIADLNKDGREGNRDEPAALGPDGYGEGPNLGQVNEHELAGDLRALPRPGLPGSFLSLIRDPDVLGPPGVLAASPLRPSTALAEL